jgi:hypothetical protein
VLGNAVESSSCVKKHEFDGFFFSMVLTFLYQNHKKKTSESKKTSNPTHTLKSTLTTIPYGA